MPRMSHATGGKSLALLGECGGGRVGRGRPKNGRTSQNAVQFKWRRRGLWETIITALRERLRIELGRDPQPSAAIIDSQTVKTSEKGARSEGATEATMAGRKSKGASAISSSIRKASC
jgi:hypothetical protein